MNMPKLLHIDSSPLYGVSVSRKLTAAFVAQWKAAHPDGTIIDRDLYATAIPPVTAAWVAAGYAPEASRTEEQKQQLSLSDTFLSELQEAGEWVIGVPMHNFGIPAVLKLWIDQVVRAGKAFAYVDGNRRWNHGTPPGKGPRHLPCPSHSGCTDARQPGALEVSAGRHHSST
jgi:FMN-dependent NADH-azoreductase